jgi:hypothetical protein
MKARNANVAPAIIAPARSATRDAEKGPRIAFFGSAGISASQTNTSSDSSELRIRRKTSGQVFFILIF